MTAARHCFLAPIALMGILCESCRCIKGVVRCVCRISVQQFVTSWIIDVFYIVTARVVWRSGTTVVVTFMLVSTVELGRLPTFFAGLFAVVVGLHAFIVSRWTRWCFKIDGFDDSKIVPETRPRQGLLYVSNHDLADYLA